MNSENNNNSTKDFDPYHRKHFTPQDPNTFVHDSLVGLTYSNPSIHLIPTQKIIHTKDLLSIQQSQVTLFSGGGSGHEPSHAGFVGSGILTAAVAGHVFASPTSSQVLHCLETIYSENFGTLVIIKNYTGDVLNFGRAIERFKTLRINQGYSSTKISKIVVQDDIGVINENDDDEGGVGRRGLAGTVLVHKVCGACAVSGGSLEEVVKVGEYVNLNCFTIGCALDPSSIPGNGKLPRLLKNDQVEMGMGIHNEPGFEKVKMKDANGLIDDMVNHVFNNRLFKEACTRAGGGQEGKGKAVRVLLLINNLGATSNLEMGLVTKLIVEAVKNRGEGGFTPVRVICGTFMTGLAMPGISLSVLVLPSDETEFDMLVSLIDLPAECPGWVNQVQEVVDYDANKEETANDDEGEDDDEGDDEEEDNEDENEQIVAQGQGVSDPVWENVIQLAFDKVQKDEPEITRLDQIMGDGDCGQVLLMGVTAILKASKATTLQLNDPPTALTQISSIVEDSMGGTSGIIYCLFLDGLAQQLRQSNSTGSKTGDSDIWRDSKLWGKAMLGALDTLYQYTTARPGHRTLIDALEPFATTLNQTGDIQKSFEAAKQGAEKTAQMKPKRGRAVYVTTDEKVPDAGAVGLVSVLSGIVDGLKK